MDFGFFNMDCMEGMRKLPDKSVDLAVVDPPYGGGASEDADDTFNGAISGRFGGWFSRYLETDKRGHMGGGHAKRYGYGHWDKRPSKEYFDELFRVSKNQIIWGGELLRIAADTMLYRLGEVEHKRKLLDGYGRVCVDFV